MPFITWKKEYEVGYAKVDDQHRELVRIINALADAMGRGQGKEEIGKVLHFLQDWLVNHIQGEDTKLAGFLVAAR